MKYEFDSRSGQLFVVIHDPEGENLDNCEFTIENIKTARKIILGTGFVRVMEEYNGKPYAITPAERQKELGNYDLSDLKLHARRIE
ncbi:MAG: hypothetical protein ACMUIE_03755 [Thermoplasmatota archaeon]